MPLVPITYDETYFINGDANGGYTLYSPTTYVDETAAQLAQKFVDKAATLGPTIIGKKVLVCGCAHGYSIQQLVALEVNAFGIDISAYAISQSPVAARIVQGNVTSSAVWTAARTLAGFTKPADKFDLVIDEDMICCLTDAEAVTFRTLAMNNSNMFIHLLEQNPALSSHYNYHTIAEWKAILGTSPKEKWYARFSWLET